VRKRSGNDDTTASVFFDPLYFFGFHGEYPLADITPFRQVHHSSLQVGQTIVVRSGECAQLSVLLSKNTTSVDYCPYPAEAKPKPQTASFLDIYTPPQRYLLPEVYVPRIPKEVHTILTRYKSSLGTYRDENKKWHSIDPILKDDPKRPDLKYIELGGKVLIHLKLGTYFFTF
jgi:hypothetical protein